MTTRIGVDSENQLKEISIRDYPEQPAALKVAANLLSYIFHPLFVPVYIAWFLISIQPYLFASFSAWEKTVVLLRFFIMYSFFPLVTVLIAKGLGFIDSVYLKTKKDRIIPYIACGVYYFWMWYVLRNQPEFSRPVVVLTMAIFLASSFGLMANIYMKVSMHAISMGVMISFIIILALSQSTAFGIYISIALLIAGLVCTARFIVSDHTQVEIYGGLFLGVLAMMVANWVS